MSVQVQHDETTNVYNLTADVDGVPIVFASVPGDTVAARIAAVQAEENVGNGGPRSSHSGGGSTSGGGFSASDFTDNGDGTYTRTSDNAVGRFTPTGFETS